MDLYCVKCKKRTSTNDVTTITTKNNRKALTGRCATCGIKKIKFVPVDKVKDGILKTKADEVILQPSW